MVFLWKRKKKKETEAGFPFLVCELENGRADLIAALLPIPFQRTLLLPPRIWGALETRRVGENYHRLTAAMLAFSLIFLSFGERE